VWREMKKKSLQGAGLQIGDLFAGQYEITTQLGAGGVGVVARATDRKANNTPVALKILYPHLVSNETVFGRFRQEIMVTRQLFHPNIVRTLDFGASQEGHHYLVMEYVDGVSLKSLIHGRSSNIPIDQIVSVLQEIIQGVSYAHEQGVVHRDLKPDNILTSKRGDIKITDFGFARTLSVDKGFTKSGESVGTPHYMAPEQIKGIQSDHRCDIYSLGIMAYELAVREVPFDGDNWFDLAMKHIKEPIPKIKKDRRDIPDWFAEIVERCCAKKPDERFQTVSELGEALKLKTCTSRVLPNTNLSMPPIPDPTHTKRPTGKMPFPELAPGRPDDDDPAEQPAGICSQLFHAILKRKRLLILTGLCLAVLLGYPQLGSSPQEQPDSSIDSSPTVKEIPVSKPAPLPFSNPKQAQRSSSSLSPAKPPSSQVLPVVGASAPTNLSLVGQPTPYWNTQNDNILRSVEFNIKNVGSGVAYDIFIQIRFPGEGLYSLKNPRNIRPKQTAKFFVPVNKSVNRNGRLFVEFGCTNCTRPQFVQTKLE